MQRRGAKKGLATLCIGGGMGVAMCVEAHVSTSIDRQDSARMADRLARIAEGAGIGSSQSIKGRNA